jgi:hypothetical protein
MSHPHRQGAKSTRRSSRRNQAATAWGRRSRGQ